MGKRQSIFCVFNSPQNLEFILQIAIVENIEILCTCISYRLRILVVI
jgi:hypothetical protein